VVLLALAVLRLEIFATTMVSPVAATPPGRGMSNPEAVRRFAQQLPKPP
jgi:putative hemolysin